MTQARLQQPARVGRVGGDLRVRRIEVSKLALR
jgi:hypothetical protein